MSVVGPPIGRAHELLRRRRHSYPLLDLSQGAPPYPPAPEVVEHIAAVARARDGGTYVDVAGLPRLRAAFAAELRGAYGGSVGEEHVLITAGCNQAFCLVTSALAGPGEEVILVLPYYFNHDMWLRLNGITPVYLDPGVARRPSAAALAAAISPRTRAVVLVSPGNPSGVTVPPDEIAAFARAAEEHGIALVLDETYRSFRDTDEAAHPLFASAGWSRTLVSLHSFAKEFAIPGYRVGAVVAAEELHRELVKLLDCVAICAPRIGQEAAWAGLVRARRWRRARAREAAEHRRRFAAAMAVRPGGFELLSVGGLFGWMRHPFAGRATDDVVEELAVDYDTLVVPGTAFLPDDRGTFRVSLCHPDPEAYGDFAGRLVAAGSGADRGRG